MKTMKLLIILLLVAAAGGLGFIYSGVYSVAANDPHLKITYWALETLRERSIARAASEISVPDLSDPEMLLSGCADYNEMCAGCHLKPGLPQTDMTLGLYPRPPDLTRSPETHDHAHPAGGHSLIDARKRQFWIIQNGIKASGMPAWGETHSDERIWAMVAFLEALPEMDALEYDVITTREEDDSGGHH